MTRRLGLLIVLAWIGAAIASTTRTAASEQGVAPGAAPADAAATINHYCVTCHNERLKTGSLNLSTADTANVAGNANVWEKVIRKLRLGAMPPLGANRPDQASYDALIGYLETSLDRQAALHPNPGRPLLHRLNRTEYANAIRDLLDLHDVDVESLLPPDNASYGFDNIADVLGVPSLLLERYLDAAGKISSMAVGDPETGPLNVDYAVRSGLSQDQHIEGLPLGTVGGLLVHHNFPLDAEYEFQARLFRTQKTTMRGMEHPNQFELAIDGQRVLLVPVGGDADLAAQYVNDTTAGDQVQSRLKTRLRVKAGEREVTAAFVEKPPTENTFLLQPLLRTFDGMEPRGRPHMDSLSIMGPFNATGPGDTASRRRIFVCRPAAAEADTRCATEIVSTLARRAYRGTASDADVRRLMQFYNAGKENGGFERGIELALRRILASPKFIFRVEAEPEHAAVGTSYRISDVELASRLSFFLWSSIPDDELLAAATRGTLGRPAGLAAEVRRMIADPRSDALVQNFAGQWLQLRNVHTVQPSSVDFPDFDDNLRQAFRRETELLFDSIIREDRGVLDLLTADYTFVNERLAKHYGIPHVYGSHFRRVPIARDARRGILGHGSILTLTSHPTRTSPVLRGKWILENILGAPPPPPPPNVPPLESQNGLEPKTMREQMELHRANAVCASCHKLMDPIGLAMENFDAVGAWRTRDGGAPINPAGQLLDGSAVDGVVTLRQALLRRSDVVISTFTEKLLTYALGRGLTAADMPTVRAIVRGAAAGNYRFSAIVNGIVSSPAFQMRIKISPEPQRAAAENPQETGATR